MLSDSSIMGYLIFFVFERLILRSNKRLEKDEELYDGYLVYFDFWRQRRILFSIGNARLP